MKQRTAVLTLALTVVVLLLGFWAGSRVDSGVGRFAPRSPESVVAQRAFETAEWFAPQSMGWLSPLVRSVRVESVEPVPGSCEEVAAAGPGRETLADYRAIVRAHTLFALPLRSYEVTCGGASIRGR